jgi:uncharacterized metal-binding protein YceD (DUF177 family)
MNDAFKIYVEQLRNGHEEDIHEELSPDFIGVNETDLSFTSPVKVDGKAYLADDSLILHFDIVTHATIPCAVCNNPVSVEVNIRNFYHAEPLEEIKTGIYNLQNLLRETILLDTPQFAECNQGQCAERERLSKYLKTPTSKADDIAGIKALDDEGYRPFSDLELGQ